MYRPYKTDIALELKKKKLNLVFSEKHVRSACAQKSPDSESRQVVPHVSARCPNRPTP